LFRIPGPGKY